jgi:DNA-binding winged helix-turn-helix (wHTH) protein
MPIVLIVDIDDLTLAALTQFIGDRAPDAAAPPPDVLRQDAPSDPDGASPSLASLKAFKPTVAADDARPSESLSANTVSSAIREPSMPRASGNWLPTHSRITLTFAGWRLEVSTRELWTANDEPVALSGGEFELLFTFAKHPKRPLTRHQIIDLMRREARLRTRSVDVYVSRLRQKLESNSRRPQIIQTVRDGYIFNVAVTIH